MLYYKNTWTRIFSIFNYIFMASICFICIAPLLHVIYASFSDPLEVQLSGGLLLWPRGDIHIDAYRIILRYRGLWTGYMNTIFYVTAQSFITTVTTVIAAYILSKKTFRYKGALMIFMLFTMLFNGGMIPTYIVIRELNLLDTRLVMLLPGAYQVFFIIIMRTSIVGIPDSLEESIRIDGGGDWTVIMRIILPICKATIAVIVLFTAVAKWNEWFTALIYLPTRKDLYPLQMYIREILVTETSVAVSGDITQIIENAQLYKTLVKYATIVVTTIPILAIYPFVQKYFVKGIIIGSVKG